MGMLHKLRPRRSDAEANARLVADIDKIVSQPVSFNLHGRVRVLKPISTEEFLKFTKAYNELVLTQEQEDVTAKTYIKNIYKMFKTVCNDISIKDIQEMNQVQIGALHGLIVRTVSGEIFTEDQESFEKKSLGQMEKAGLAK